MTCTVCHGYGFKRDGKPLSEANACDNCLLQELCPKCDQPTLDDPHNCDAVCTHCGWCWDDPENLTKAQQQLAMLILISLLTGDPLPEIADNAFIHDFGNGIQVMWDDIPSGEQMRAPLYASSFEIVVPTSYNEPEVKAIDYAARPQGLKLLQKLRIS